MKTLKLRFSPLMGGLLALLIFGAVQVVYNRYQNKPASAVDEDAVVIQPVAAPTAKPTKPMAPMYAVVNSWTGGESAQPAEPIEIVAENGRWMRLDSGKMVVPGVDWRYGSGESFLMRSPVNGQVDEVYENYCTDYDNKAYKCRKEETVVVRSRWIHRGQLMRIISGAIVKWGAVDLLRPADDNPWRTTPIKEVRDPEWQPGKIDQHFSSVADLHAYADMHDEWVVVGSRLGAPLFGYDRPKARIYIVENDGKEYPAFLFRTLSRDLCLTVEQIYNIIPASETALIQTDKAVARLASRSDR